MAYAAIVHLSGEEAILGDLDDVPDPLHTFIMLRNIRKKDGKPLAYVADGATTFLYGWNRITFIEIMGEVAGVGGAKSEPARPAGTTVLGFFREDEK